MYKYLCEYISSFLLGNKELGGSQCKYMANFIRKTAEQFSKVTVFIAFSRVRDWLIVLIH